MYRYLLTVFISTVFIDFILRRYKKKEIGNEKTLFIVGG